MAINRQTLADIMQDTSDLNTTENLFRGENDTEGLYAVLTQVDLTQQHMDAPRSITLTGDVNGSVTDLQWNDANDYNISMNVQLNAGAITGADIATNTITASNIADNAIQTRHITDGSVTNNKIASTARRRLTIYDTNGSTVLFEADGLIPL